MAAKFHVTRFQFDGDKMAVSVVKENEKWILRLSRGEKKTDFDLSRKFIHTGSDMDNLMYLVDLADEAATYANINDPYDLMDYYDISENAIESKYRHIEKLAYKFTQIGVKKERLGVFYAFINKKISALTERGR